MVSGGRDVRHLRVVGALVRRAGLVMLTRRPPGRSQALKWEFPGGKVHAGETDAHALERELEEELGIHARVGSHYLTIDHEYEDFRITLAVYECEIDGQEPRCLEVAEIAWVPPGAVIDFDLTPADVPVARKLLEESSGL